MEQFLAEVERRALIMAELATRDREEALDLVQDTMAAFVSRYGNHPRDQWPPLFHRILQNRIRDWHRRRKGWSRWLVEQVRPQSGPEEDDADHDPLQNLPDQSLQSPETALMTEQSMERLLCALENLPLRQQQAFLLRVWEGFDVATTAAAMGCSSGSVKTHLSRALNTLRKRLPK